MNISGRNHDRVWRGLLDNPNVDWSWGGIVIAMHDTRLPPEIRQVCKAFLKARGKYDG